MRERPRNRGLSISISLHAFCCWRKRVMDAAFLLCRTTWPRVSIGCSFLAGIRSCSRRIAGFADGVGGRFGFRGQSRNREGDAQQQDVLCSHGVGPRDCVIRAGSRKSCAIGRSIKNQPFSDIRRRRGVVLQRQALSPEPRISAFREKKMLPHNDRAGNHGCRPAAPTRVALRAQWRKNC